jgi:hypothetical protein
MSDVARILSTIEHGDSAAAEALLPVVYDELRSMAAQHIAREKPGQTLDATALVHEPWLRLVDVEPADHWNGRRHFIGAAAQAMRRILVDRARARRSLKRGGRRDESTYQQRATAPSESTPRFRGRTERSICERCSVGSNTGGPRAVRTRRCSSSKSMCRDGVRSRPHSFNAAAAGKFLGRFVEFRSGHSTMR